MPADSDFNSPTYEEFIKSLGKESHLNVDVPFDLLSTIRYDPLLSKSPPKSVQEITRNNFFLLSEHVERLKFELKFFGQLGTDNFSISDAMYDIDEDDVLNKLKHTIDQSKADIRKPLKVRLLVSKTGIAKIELYETPDRKDLLDGLLEKFPDSKRYDVYVDSTPVLASPFTSFKTTYRPVYNEARQRALPGRSVREEVILINTISEVMEGSITSIAIRSKQGVWITPKLTSGCLCGVMRHFLLKKNMMKEGDISAEMLKPGHDVMLMNGVMGCVRGTIKEAV